MERIDAHFLAFSEVSFQSLFRAIGVYVIWDARQVARPSYIGEGNILRRFAVEHASRFAAPIEGYLAILGDTSRTAFKLHSRALELLLLEAAVATDRCPTVNEAPGSYSSLVKLTNRHGTVRFALSGFDPFRPPWRTKRLQPGTRITARPSAEGMLIEHPWQLRRR